MEYLGRGSLVYETAPFFLLFITISVALSVFVCMHSGSGV